MREKELRLALVCYGGISLAVYMHGITKEIWRLTRASRAHCDGTDAGGGSQGVYHALLAEMEAASGTRQRVLTDIIAGASAGGINGVFLAHAITTGQSLEPLTDLWLNGADIEALLDPDSAPGSRMTKFWALPIAWMAANRADGVDATVDVEAREEVRAKLARFVRSRWFTPPFGGKRLIAMMLDAFAVMAKTPGKRLLPVGQPLDLFVTVTDFRGRPERLRLNSPPEVIETEHRMVLSFTDHAADDASFVHPAELVFAARATSSFPGAFPPFTVRELDEVLAERGIAWPGRDAFLSRVLPRQMAAGEVENVAMIDGSVLANAPFRPAIEALRQRPAHRQIDRRFVYIDPSPGMKIGLYNHAQATPGFFQILLGALSELPRQQPIADNLEVLSDRSATIERMLAIVEKLRGEVEAQVVGLFGYTLFLDYPTPKRLSAWRRRAQIAASNRAGYSHTAYGLLKIDGVIDRIATLLHSLDGKPGPDQWRRMRDTIAATVATRGEIDLSTTLPSGASGATIGLLRSFDLGFRIRRLRLLARRLAEIEGDHDDEMLVPMREAIYESLAHYLDLERSDRFHDLGDAVKAIEGQDAGAVLDTLAAAMDLTTLDATTDARLSAALSNLSKDVRRPILLAYLGFPFFDIATLPLLQGEGLDEFDPIRVDRISPDDARSIRAGAAATLKGIQFHSFGAFFSRAYRENDYLWGRLHGAERMIDITLSTLAPAAALSPERVAAIKRAAFRAILDEEQPRLTNIAALFRALRSEVG